MFIPKKKQLIAATAIVMNFLHLQNPILIAGNIQYVGKC